MILVYFQVVSKSYTVESSDEYNTDVINTQLNIAEPDMDGLMRFLRCGALRSELANFTAISPS